MSYRKSRIAINGLGRIGRLAFRLLWENPAVEIVAVNDLAPNAMLAYLLKYDSSQGKWEEDPTADDEYIYVNGHKVLASAHKDALECPWGKLEVDVVIECSGHFRTLEKASLHLQAGAKRIAISAPAEQSIKTIVLGINDKMLSAEDTIISNASCTTNCLAPMAKLLHDNFDIQQAIMSTTHAYTADQNLQDSIHKSDYRRGRAAAMNIVPTTTNATKAMTWVIPELKGKITGGAIRVPVVAGSLTELFAIINKPATPESINAVFENASKGSFKGILGYTNDPIVSTDIIHSPYSCLFDAELTTVQGSLVKITGWYDNEYGYANRLVELVLKWVKL